MLNSSTNARKTPKDTPSINNLLIWQNVSFILNRRCIVAGEFMCWIYFLSLNCETLNLFTENIILRHFSWWTSRKIWDFNFILNNVWFCLVNIRFYPKSLVSFYSSFGRLLWNLPYYLVIIEKHSFWIKFLGKSTWYYTGPQKKEYVVYSLNFSFFTFKFLFFS